MSDPSGCPAVLPIFPLTGALLLPGGHLPLHIFEPRYRAMVADAVEGDGFIGMIQPAAAIEGDDKQEEPVAPELYEVGCAGRIEHCERLPDGRYIILLQGIARFRVARELESERGYRRVMASYEGFAGDLEEERTEIESERLMEALRAFGETHRIRFELDRLDQLPGPTLLNSLAMALPFPPAEKQALLEAADAGERLETLLALMTMGIELGTEVPDPTLN